MATKTQSKKAKSNGEMTTEEKIDQLRELFEDPPEVGRSVSSMRSA